MLKLTTKPFTSCVLCNLLIHMQNNSLQSSQMCRKQNFKVVFGFKSGTAVLTFPFRFLLPSSFPGHLVGFISEDKMVYCDASNEILQKDVLLSYKQFFTDVLLSVYSVNPIFSNCLHGCLIIMRALLSLNLQNISAYFFFQLWKGQLEVLMPKETVQPGHMNILLQPMPLLKIM